MTSQRVRAASEAEFHDDLHSSDGDPIPFGPVLTRYRGEFIALLRKRLELTAGSEVLSLGCGLGLMEAELAPHVKRIHGLDISPVAIERARAQFSHLTALTFEVSGAQTLQGIPSSSYDVVIAMSFFHHIVEAETPRLLAEVARVLKPGGSLVTLDPSDQRFIAHLKFLVRKTYDRHHSPDERELSPSGLARRMEAAGLRIRRRYWFDFAFQAIGYLLPGTPPWLVTPLWWADRIGVSLPGLRALSSSFLIHAQKDSRR